MQLARAGKMAKCKPYPATGLVNHKKAYPIHKYMQRINHHVDWDVEGVIGYVKRQPDARPEVLQ